MRCEHEHDDGAYVLGALSPAERAAYERHLATCSFCREAVSKTLQAFGHLDILINNASAISLTTIEKTSQKAYALMQDINVKGTFFVSQACVPYLKQATNAHILTLSPPINMDEKWFASHLAYTISKYNMTMIAMGLSGELKDERIASNTLWPRTTIATAAIRNLPGGERLMQMSRTPEIVADAAFFILKRPSAQCTGNSFKDEEVLMQEGITDFTKYYAFPEGEGRLFTDLFL